MTRPPVIAFGNLRDTAAKHGVRARFNTFDGGESVELIDLNGKQLCRVTALYGDEHTAVELAGLWLIEHGYVVMADFEGLVTVLPSGYNYPGKSIDHGE